MADSPAERSTLESLVIELLGDDSNLIEILRGAVRMAEEYAAKVTAAFTQTFAGVEGDAAKVRAAFESMSTPVVEANAIIDEFARESGRAFDKVIERGKLGEQAFEEYRRQTLETLESQRPLAQQLGYTGQSLDNLATKVRNASYQQAEHVKQTERSEQAQKELDETIRNLAAQVATQRNLWVNRITTDEEFRASTSALREELLELMKAGQLTDVEMRKVTQSMAYAQRGIDSANRVASRGGLAWTAQIALANQFGQELRNLGPAGSAAASAMGFFQGSLSSLQRPLSAADFQLNKLLVGFLKAPNIIALATGALAVGAGAALTKLTLDAAKYAKEIEVATYRTSLSAEALQELRHAATQAGVPTAILETTMQRLQRRAADAAAGNEGLRRAFDGLGVSLTDANGKLRGTEELLDQVADGLSAVENDAERLRRAFQIFDTEGGRLLPLLAKGSEGIREMRQEARDLGLVISGDTLMSLSQFQAEIDTLARSFEVIRVELGAAFLPVLRDVLLPLIRDELVPWISNLAIRVGDFSDSLFDTSAAGTVFRQDLVQSLQVLLGFGKGIVAAAQGVAGLVQTILGGAANLGAFLGTVTSGVNFRAIEQSFLDMEETYLRLQQEVWDNPLKFNVEPWSTEQAQLAQEYGEQAIAAAAAAVEAGGGRFGQAWRSVMENEMGGGLMGQAIASFEAAWDTIGFDFEQWLEDFVQNAAIGATPEARRALTEFVAEVTGGLGEAPPAGSLAEAEAMIQKYAKAFREATTHEARVTAIELRDEWQAVADAIKAAFEEDDVLAPARLWTERLTAELREGVKNASLDVIPMLEAALERLDAEATAAFELGWDSQEYRDTIRKIEFIESYLERVKRDYGAVDLEIDLSYNILPPPVDILPDLVLPEQAKSAAQGLVEYYTRLTRAADATARLDGVTTDTRDAFEETIDILERILPGLDEMSDDWFAVVGLLAQARDRLEAVNEELATPGGALTRTLFAAASAATQLGDALREAQLGQVRRDAEGVAGAFASLLSTTMGLRRDELLAGFLGDDFDRNAAEAARLEAEIRSLVDRYDDLSVAERLRLVMASNRLEVVRGLIAADEDAADATEALTAALREWGAAVAAMGADEDPLLARARQLEEWLATGQITLEEYREMLEQVAAAQERLNARVDDGQFEAWIQSVGRMGIVLDPVSAMLADLGAMLADGAIDAEQYALGVDMANAALDRLADAEHAAEIEKVAAAWESAEAQIRSFLRVAQADFDDFREAAVAAFDAGQISAEELLATLRVITAMELAENFRILASELDGLQSLIPNLAADLVQGFAQIASGGTADGIATLFRSAAGAVDTLGDAFSDTANQGEAMLDLLIGGAAGIAAAFGGPALGQAVGAVGQFIKSILGDLSNGLKQIQESIDRTALSSQYLGIGLIEGIAAGATSRVSRGGILGFFGATKAELDEGAFRAGITMAEGIARGLVGTLTSGDFEDAWKRMIDDILVTGVIEAFMATALVQDAIQEAMKLIMGGDAAGGAAALDRIRSEFHAVWQTIQSITTAGLPTQEELERSVLFSLPDATVSVLAAPQWALNLGSAAERMVGAGDAMLEAASTIQDTFSGGIAVTTQSTRGIDATRSL